MPNGKRFYFTDFKVREDVYIYGKVIRIYDDGQLTRGFGISNGIILISRQELPEDPFIKKMTTKPKLAKDNIIKEYLEYSIWREVKSTK